MQARFTLREIERAWPAGIRALFAAKGIRLLDTGTPADVVSIRFAEPCRWWWDENGDLVVEQP